jgi:tetratricopeptide (TPR) repeat protein
MEVLPLPRCCPTLRGPLLGTPIPNKCTLQGERLLERQAARGLVGDRGWAYHSLGRAALRLGRLDEARRLADHAVESSPGHHGFAAHARHLLGDIATHPDRFDTEGGEARYRQALALAEPRGMRPLVAHCHLGLGELYRRASKRPQAQEHLTTATTMYRQMSMNFWLEKSEAAMGPPHRNSPVPPVTR